MKLFQGVCLGMGAAGRTRRVAILLAWLALLGCGGCRPAPADAPAEAPVGSARSEAAPAAREDASQAAASPKDVAWYVCYIEGSRVGYERTAITPLVRDGRPLVRVEGLSHMAVKRFQEETTLEVQLSDVETPDGRLLEFESRFSQGPVPMQVAGRVVGDKLQINTTTKGKALTQSIPWSADYGGFAATEQSLRRRPMTPGERRTIRALVPGFNVLGTGELVARDYEPVELLAGTYQLLRIDTTTTFPGGQAMKGSIWTDRTGQVQKNWLEAMNIESYRATRAEALAETQPAEFDLGLDVAVPVDRPLESPHRTKRVRYRVKLEGGDPAGVFESGPSQQVKSIDPHTAEVTVFAVRPGGPLPNPEAPDDPPTDDDRKPNSLIQSDDPAIVAKAQEAGGDPADPWQVAVALERCAGDVITSGGYSQAFATAAEVIETGRGDCTEHAVLLAALARARQIPARVAMGLVYQDQAFYYHMWTEVYVAGRWVALDATLGQGGIGAAHLKMAHTSLKGASALSSLLPVLQVIGRLQIEILDVE